MNLTISTILSLIWPDRQWQVNEGQEIVITALDGGSVPSLQEVESRRAEAEAIQAGLMAGRGGPTPEEAMKAARAAMAAILDALPLSDRMELQSLRVQVEAALDKGQTDLAFYIVTQAEVEPHLLPVKAQILALFPQA